MLVLQGTNRRGPAEENEKGWGNNRLWSPWPVPMQLLRRRETPARESPTSVPNPQHPLTGQMHCRRVSVPSSVPLLSYDLFPRITYNTVLKYSTCSETSFAVWLATSLSVSFLVRKVL